MGDPPEASLRRCKWCSERFDPRPQPPRPRGPWSQYCSDDCRRAAARAREYLRRVAGKTVPDYKAKRRERNKRLVAAAKDQPCWNCGRPYPAVAMDFHHRDPRTKLATIAQLVNRGVAVHRLEAEIAKCDLLCANCHRVITAEQRAMLSPP